MTNVSRQQLSRSIAQLMPHIIQGAHLGFFIHQKITHTQFFVMVMIHSQKRCALKTLAKNMKVSMPTMSGVVDRMVDSGHVRRFVDDKDRRHVIIELTPKGEKFIKQFQEVISLRWEEVLKVLNPKEINMFASVIMHVKEGIMGRV